MVQFDLAQTTMTRMALGLCFDSGDENLDVDPSYKCVSGGDGPGARPFAGLASLDGPAKPRLAVRNRSTMGVGHRGWIGLSMGDGQEGEPLITGAEIIDEILRNMDEGLEPLRYSVLAPGIYRVYLHARDYDRLKGVFPRISAEAQRALDEALRKLNRPPRLPFPRRETPRHESATGSWELRFYQDWDDDLGPGDVNVISDLAHPLDSGRGAGIATRRVVTRRGQAGAQTVVDEGPAPAAGPVLARISYTDAEGEHCYEMLKDQIVIGRGGMSHWCDLELDASRDVSREHLRLRHDPATGRFLMKDMSTFGTALNGRRVPSSVEESNGTKRDLNIEVELPPMAQIGLADVVVLRFEAQTEPGTS